MICPASCCGSSGFPCRAAQTHRPRRCLLSVVLDMPARWEPRTPNARPIHAPGTHAIRSPERRERRTTGLKERNHCCRAIRPTGQFQRFPQRPVGNAIMSRDAGAQHIRRIIRKVLKEISPVARIHDVIFQVPVVVVARQAMESAEKHPILVAGYFVGKITEGRLYRGQSWLPCRREPVPRGGTPWRQPGFVVIEEDVVTSGTSARSFRSRASTVSPIRWLLNRHGTFTMLTLLM